MEEEKTLGVTSGPDLEKKVSDVQTWGDPNEWQLICKAWSEKQGWMRSTKAMVVKDRNGRSTGCLVQVSTHQKNADGPDSVAESVVFLPDYAVQAEAMSDGTVVSRVIVSTEVDPYAKPFVPEDSSMDSVLK